MIFKHWFHRFYIIFWFLASATYANGYNCTAEEELQKDCKIVTTDSYEYNDFFSIGEENLNKNITIVFYVKGEDSASILLSEEQSSIEGRVYEITLGDKNNTRSIIRTELTTSDYGIEKIHNETNIISSNGWREFWIHVSVDGFISVGKQNAKEPFLSWRDLEPFTVNYYSFGSESNHVVHWLHQCLLQKDDRLTKYYEEKLKCHLFSKHSPYFTPVNASKIAFNITADHVEWDPNNEEFTLYGLFGNMMSWTEETSTWDPKEYNEQHSLLIREDPFQHPLLMEMKYGRVQIESQNEKTIIYENGTVFWSIIFLLHSKCNNIHSSFWPKDSFTCQLEFFSKSREIEMDITNSGPNVSPPPSWKIKQIRRINSTRTRDDEIPFSTTFELILETNVNQTKFDQCGNIESNLSRLDCHLNIQADHAQNKRHRIPPHILRHEGPIPILSFINFYADLVIQGTFQVIGEVTGVWIDERLTWNPKEFGDIEIRDFENESWKFWSPEVTLKNHAFTTDQPFGPSRGILMYNGTVHWTASLNIQAKCNINMASWSQNNHTCRLDLNINTPEVEIIATNGKNASIQSPSMIGNARIVNYTKGEDLSNNHSLSVEIQIHKNIDRLQSSNCTSLRNYTEKLSCQLFSNYDPSRPPDNSIDRVLELVEIEYFYTNLDENGILQLNGEIHEVWTDERFVWKSKDYGDTEILVIENELGKIWRPIVTLDNNVFPSHNLPDFGRAELLYFGIVYWITPLNIQVKCGLNNDQMRWPWNSHTCQLNFTIQTSSFDAIISLNKRNKAELESPWIIKSSESHIVRATQKSYLTKYPTSYSISVEVELERNDKLFQSTRCTSFARNYEEKLKCHLNSKLNLSTPAWEVVFGGPRIGMKISFVDLNIEHGILRLDGGVKMKWKDERLAWDPEKFGGQFSLNIGDTETGTDSVWKPSFALINDDFNDNPFNFGRIVSTPNGDLTWISPMNIKVRCAMSSRSWPWDPQICLVHLFINVRDAHFNFLKVHHFETPWKITNIDVKKTYQKFTLEITLQSNNVSLQIVLCSIFVVLNLIVLSSFLISPSKKIKIVAKAVSSLLLILYLILLEFSIPHFNSQASHFLIGYVTLLLIVGISSGPTAYLVRLAESSSSHYLSLNMNLIEQQKNQCREDTIKKCFIEAETENSKLKKFQKDWLKIAMVIEWLLFIICAVLALLLTGYRWPISFFILFYIKILLGSCYVQCKSPIR